MSWEWLLGCLTAILGKAAEILGVAKFIRERNDAKSRVRAEIIKSHRELLSTTPKTLFDRNRNLELCPRTEEETNAVRFLLIHFAWALSEHRKGRYELPNALGEDIRDFLSYPAINDAWLELKRYHAAPDVAFVESALSQSF